MKLFLLLLAGCWLMPAADLTGKWVAETQGPSGESRSFTIQLQVEGDKVTGSVGSVGGTAPATEIREGSLQGDQVTFLAERGPFKMRYQGQITGEVIHFAVTRAAVPGDAEGAHETAVKFDAHRAAAE